MTHRIICSLLIAYGISEAGAAELPGGTGKDRHRFAQLYLGVELENGRKFTGDRLSTGQVPMLRVGGMHFWGRACFSIAFPVIRKAHGYRQGVETAAKFYWWQTGRHRLTPYTGLAWWSLEYGEAGSGTVRFFKYPLSGGCVWQKGAIQISAGVTWIRRNKLVYHLKPDLMHEYRLQSIYPNLGFRFLLETTVSAEKNWKNGITIKRTDSLARLGKLNGLIVSLGFSTGIRLKESEFISNGKLYLGNQRSYRLFAETGLGYYFHNPDIQLNAAWRSMKAVSIAGNESFITQRKSLVLEVYKFMTDYHGFAMFAGPAVSVEKLSAAYITEYRQTLTAADRFISPGLTVGWDIRPDRLQAFYLRTALRWFPGLLLNKNGFRERLDTLEINFIQLIVFPDRLFTHK